MLAEASLGSARLEELVDGDEGLGKAGHAPDVPQEEPMQFASAVASLYWKVTDAFDALDFPIDAGHRLGGGAAIDQICRDGMTRHGATTVDDETMLMAGGMIATAEQSPACGVRHLQLIKESTAWSRFSTLAPRDARWRERSDGGFVSGERVKVELSGCPVVEGDVVSRVLVGNDERKHAEGGQDGQVVYELSRRVRQMSEYFGQAPCDERETSSAPCWRWKRWKK
jgi:hypothetical protein